MKTTIYLIRHCESDHSVTDAKTRPLTEKGLRDAERLAEVLKDTPVSRIFSSPYLRACQTVMPICKARNIELQTDSRMREWMGGRPFANEHFEGRMQEMFENESNVYGGAESLKALKKRTNEFIMHLLSRFSGETVFIGTHALAMTAALKSFDDRIGLDFLMNMLPVTPYFAVMEFEKFELKSLRFLDPFDKGENV